LKKNTIRIYAGFQELPPLKLFTKESTIKFSQTIYEHEPLKERKINSTQRSMSRNGMLGNEAKRIDNQHFEKSFKYDTIFQLNSLNQLKMQKR